MTEKKTWMKQLDAHGVARGVQQYGSIFFIGTGLSDFELADIAAKTIGNLAKENLDLTMFFVASVHSDDSYESIQFVADTNNTTTMATLIRVTSYRPMFNQRPTVLRGPAIHKDHAAAFLEMLNAQFWGVPREIPGEARG